MAAQTLYPTVDELLDAIDLEFTGYVPSDDALEFFAIIRMLQGKDFEVPNAKAHYFMVDMIYGNVTYKDFPFGELNEKIRINKRAIAIAAARGSSKSTIVTLFFPIVCAIKGKTPAVGNFSNMLVLSDTQEGGSKSQYTIMKEFIEKNKDRFKMFFESWKAGDYKVEFTRIGKGSIEKRHMQIVFKGSQTGGIRSGSRNPVTGERYAIIAGDDILSKEEDAKSDTIVEKVKKSIFVDAKFAMRNRNKQIILVNTLYTKTDPVYSMLESGAYTPLVMPICKDIYEGLEKKDFIGLWEDYHSYETIMEDYNDAIVGGQTRGFMQELMCRIANNEERIVQDNRIKWYGRGSIFKNLDNMNFYVTTDFTSSDEKSSDSDFSGLILWGVDWKRNHYLIDIALRFLGTEEQYDVLFDMLDKWCTNRFSEVGVEIDGNQRIHIIGLKQKMQLEGRYFNFARQRGSTKLPKPGQEGIMSKAMGRDKLERFKMMAPMISQGSVYFPEDLRATPDLRELMNEIKYATWTGLKSKRDDGIDTLSMLNHIEILYPEMPEDVVMMKEQRIMTPQEAMLKMLKNSRDGKGRTIEYDNVLKSYT